MIFIATLRVEASFAACLRCSVSTTRPFIKKGRRRPLALDCNKNRLVATRVGYETGSIAASCLMKIIGKTVHETASDEPHLQCNFEPPESQTCRRRGLLPYCQSWACSMPIPCLFHACSMTNHAPCPCAGQGVAKSQKSCIVAASHLKSALRCRRQPEYVYFAAETYYRNRLSGAVGSIF